jgi:hypothetical protein
MYPTGLEHVSAIDYDLDHSLDLKSRLTNKLDSGQTGQTLQIYPAKPSPTL